MITIYDPKGLMKFKFKCPECGGPHSGPDTGADWNESIGHCHSLTPEGLYCTHRWLRSEKEDAKHFVPREHS